MRTWKQQTHSICMEEIETASGDSLKRQRNESKEEGSEINGSRTKKGRKEKVMAERSNMKLAKVVEKPCK